MSLMYRAMRVPEHLLTYLSKTSFEMIFDFRVSVLFYVLLARVVDVDY